MAATSTGEGDQRREVEPGEEGLRLETKETRVPAAAPRERAVTLPENSTDEPTSGHRRDTGA